MGELVAKQTVKETLSTQDPFHRLEGMRPGAAQIVIDTAADVLNMSKEDLLETASSLDRIGDELGQTSLIGEYHHKKALTELTEDPEHKYPEAHLRLGVATRLVTLNIAAEYSPSGGFQLQLPDREMQTVFVLSQSLVYHAIFGLTPSGDLAPSPQFIP